jgi:hypothetical protein
VSENWKEKLANKRKEAAESDLKWFAEYDDKTCFEASEEFKKGYAAARCFYEEISRGRGDLLVTERLFLEKKTKELIKAEQKIKDLVAEAEFYSKAMHEVEAHWLTRCVRFCQTFGNRVRYKLRDIYYGARHLVGAILPRKKGYKRECRSTLHQTLQAHLKDKKEELKDE